MKHSIKFGLMGGMILFCLSMCLTSCEDILGEWSKPTPTPVTPGGGGGSSATVTSLTLGKSLRFDKNDLTAQTLTATVTPSNATITWSSDKESVATVDATGKVTPVAPGEATITAKAGDKTATRTVYVYDKIVDISNDISVDAGESWLINGTGTKEDHSITIANNSKVTLNGINITKGINCTDNATIILADNSTNSVTAPDEKAGIKIGDAATETLTIDAETEGTGKLTAQGGKYGAGIGTGGAEEVVLSGGNIVINGGTVTATGGDYGAGIGTGRASNNVTTATITCGDITINGGTVTAQGGEGAAGIGTGPSYNNGVTASNECGAIKIGTGVISVTAKKSSSNPGPNSIGKGDLMGSGSSQTCGTITFGTAAVFNGSAWTPSDPLTAGAYGGLNLAISGNDWKLTPVAP